MTTALSGLDVFYTTLFSYNAMVTILFIVCNIAFKNGSCHRQAPRLNLKISDDQTYLCFPRHQHAVRSRKQEERPNRLEAKP